MKWFSREILPIRHRYNCQVNDAVYPPPMGWIGKWLLKIYHRIHGVPTSGFRTSERAIEVPLAIDFLSNYVKTEPVVELGCVLPYYLLKKANHIVCDLTDKHPQNFKRDIREIGEAELSGNVISISTIEHIGLNEYGIAAKEGVSAIDVLRLVVSNARRYFVTFPLGHNTELDRYVLNRCDLGERYVTRNLDDANDWHEVDKAALTDKMMKYGTYHRANTICVLMKT